MRNEQAERAAGPRGLLRAGLPALLLLALAGPVDARSDRQPDPHLLHLRAGSFDPLRDPVPGRGFAVRDAYPEGARGAYVVLFEQPITAADRSALEAEGAAIGGSLPSRALEVVMTEAQSARVAGLAGVRWVGPYQDGWKLSERLRERVDRAAAGEPLPPRLRLRLTLFAGAHEEALAALRGLGARVLRDERARSFSLVDVELPSSRVRSLVGLSLVRSVQNVPVRIPHNDRARVITGLASVASDDFSLGFDPTLDGRDDASGFQVKYGHTDGGLWISHPDFAVADANGWISFAAGADLDDPSGHGTHTAGSLIGDGSSWNDVTSVIPGSGPASPFRWRGVQPEAALHHMSMASVLSDRQVFETHQRAGAQILTNSWGYAECETIFCGAVTDYEASAAMWDEGVWDADEDAQGQQPVIAFFAAGNGAIELLNGCPLFGSSDDISSPGTAKNVITVGASETDRACAQGEGDDEGDVLFVSSRGPVDPDASGQGLYKPDLVAVGGAFVMSSEREGTGGAASASGFDDPLYCGNTGPSYRFEGGTSMACPLAAGIGGVLLQDLVVNYGIASPSPSLVKALLVNGALAIEPSGGCDYSFEVDAHPVHRGWGLVQADASLYGAAGTPGSRDVSFENEEHALATGEIHQVDVAVAAGDSLKVTLVWSDAPAAPAAGSPLVVNDLDLEVIGPGASYLGNNFAGDWSAPFVPAAGGQPAANDVPDRYNVVENVYVESAAAGTWTLRVTAHQVSQDQEPDLPGVEQDFSLVWSTESLDVVPLPEPRLPLALLPGLFLVGWLGHRRARRAVWRRSGSQKR